MEGGVCTYKKWHLVVKHSSRPGDPTPFLWIHIGAYSGHPFADSSLIFP